MFEKVIEEHWQMILDAFLYIYNKKQLKPLMQ